MLALLLALLLAWGARAQDAPGLRQFSVIDAGLRVDQLLEGRYDSQFLPVEGGRAHLRAGSEYTHWLRLDTPREVGRQLLVLDRVPAERISVFASDASGQYSETELRMFRPLPGMHWPATLIGVPFDGGAGRPVYLSVVTRVPIALEPRTVDADDFGAADRGRAAAVAAALALLVAVPLFMLVLYLAVRDGVYARHAALATAWLLLAAAVGGQLYPLPGLAMAGWWGVLGLAALELVVAALSLWFAGGVLLAPPRPRWLRIATIVLAAAAAFVLLNLQALAAPLRVMSLAALVASQLLAFAIALRAAMVGRTLGRALAPAFALALVLAGVHALAALFPAWGIDLGTVGFTVAAGLVSLLFALALLDRVADLRRERDRAQAMAQQVDSTLQVEASRRELVEGLQQALRSAPPGDLEWLAFRRLLAALDAPVPHRASAIVAYGYHGLDLLLAEPSDAKPRIVALLEQRGGNVKGICRGRTPLSIRLDPPAEGAGGDADGATEALVGVYAVVPLVIAKPGWGALLLERESEDFSPAEMRVASELAQITVSAADEAASKVELTRRAEIDPLTGAFNRRAAEQAMEEMFTRALDGRLPVSLVVLDLDRFAALNERHGHEVGDRCLRAVAEAIRALLQPGDLLARMGADEFAVMLPGRAIEAGRELAERMLAAIAQVRVRQEPAIVSVTASAGVAARGDEESPAPMLTRATRAAETARRSGGNRVQVQGPRFGSAGEEPPEPLVL